MAEATVSFDVQVPVGHAPHFLENLCSILQDIPHELGPFTVKIAKPKDWLLAEVTWRGEVFAKFEPPRQRGEQDGHILLLRWSEGGSPTGEWGDHPYTLCTLGRASRYLLEEIKEHARQILEEADPRVKNAAAALQLLSTLETLET